jgi:hypothetical protein
MKSNLALITALTLSPLAVFAQAKLEVANATKAAKPAWESAPAEKRALWLEQREALTHIDLVDDTPRQVVVARGTPNEVSRTSDYDVASRQRARVLHALSQRHEFQRPKGHGETDHAAVNHKAFHDETRSLSSLA